MNETATVMHNQRGAQRATIGEWRRRRLTLPELLTLLDRGCAPELAARILAPLESGAS